MFIYHQFTKTELHLGLQHFSVRENLLEKKAEIFIIAGSCHILRVLQWNDKHWQYCVKRLPMYYFLSIRIHCKLKCLRKMAY